ncbi:hypothetical protein J6590_020827 [Homalodisca vitripennis]|nr:hypothetical protein J6590_020827 [Homalodisca vitripennis]
MDLRTECSRLAFKTQAHTTNQPQRLHRPLDKRVLLRSALLKFCSGISPRTRSLLSGVRRNHLDTYRGRMDWVKCYSHAYYMSLHLELTTHCVAPLRSSPRNLPLRNIRLTLYNYRVYRAVTQHFMKLEFPSK